MVRQRILIPLAALALVVAAVFYRSSVRPAQAQSGCAEITSVSTNVSSIKAGEKYDCTVTVGSGAGSRSIACGISFNGGWPYDYCPSDEFFEGWSGSNARFGCVFPNTNFSEEITKVELVGYDFQEGCGPEQGKRVEIQYEKSSDKPVVTDPASEQKEARSSLRKLLEALFGSRSGSSGGSSGGSTGGSSGGNTGGNTGGGSPAEPVPADTQKLADCVSSGIGGAFGERWKPHMPLILNEAKTRGLTLPQTAYLLATTQHETAHLNTLREYGDCGYFSMYQGRSDLCNTQAGDGCRFYGRGYVQITGRCNYTKFTAMRFRASYQNYPDYSDIFKNPRDFTTQPDLIIEELEATAAVLVKGCGEGIFTGRRLSDYINSSGVDYVNARRVVNGTDKANQIAGYATNYENLLRSCSAS
jgi:hypothetical protein